MIAFAGELSKSLGDTARSLQGLHKESCWCRESTPGTAALKSRQRVIFFFFSYLAATVVVGLMQAFSGAFVSCFLSELEHHICDASDGTESQYWFEKIYGKLLSASQGGMKTVRITA